MQEVPPNFILCTEKPKGLSPNTLTQKSFAFQSTIQEENIRPVEVANILESNYRRRRHEPESPEAVSQWTAKLILKSVQADAFQEEMVYLQIENKSIDSAPLERKGSLFWLAPWIDKENILRVDGRLKGSTLPFEVKQPLI